MTAQLENDLQNINRNIIALPEDEVKRNNRILEQVVLDQIIPTMKKKTGLFEFLYRNIFYAGSFFCGLKAGHPDEYDLAFLMELPEYLKPILTLCTNIPGFVQIQLQGMKQLAEGHKDRPFISDFNSTKIANSEVAEKCQPKVNSQQKTDAIQQWEKVPKAQRNVSDNATRTSQSTVIPKKKPRPYRQQIHVRTPKIHKLWNTIRSKEDLSLTKQERVILSSLVNLLDDSCRLDTTKVSAWIEEIIRRTYNDFDIYGEYTFIKTSEGSLKAKLLKSGPAFTLKLKGKSNHKHIVMDIDLVPGFVFSSEQWPPRPFRPNPVPEKPEFFIVPKKPTKNSDFTRCWRPSFQEQECVLINDLQNFKPCIRLLKRIRDVDKHESIASYHIKTIFLWELKNNRRLWSKPLSKVFMRMLRRCQRIFEDGVILNYWNKKDNLIKDLSESTLDNIANNFLRIINDIERNPNHIYRHLYGKNNKSYYQC